MELKDFCKRLSDLGYSLQLTDNAKEFIADAGCDIQYGARPLKRIVQAQVETMLAKKIIAREIVEGSDVEVGYDKKEKKLKIWRRRLPNLKKSFKQAVIKKKLLKLKMKL